MPGLQALRFFAAMGVFAHHLVAYAGRSDTISLGFTSARIGGSGVIVFFVLSGFLMAMISENARPLAFLRQRALRIYPGLWLAVAIGFALKVSFVDNLPDYNWLAALTLFPNGKMHYPLNVEWTLVFEVFFYCVVAGLCFIPSLRARQALVAIWAAAVLLFGTKTYLPEVSDIALAFPNIAFIIGMATWWARSILPFRGPLAFVAGLGLLCVGFYVVRGNAPEPWPWICQAAGCALMVLAGARATLFSDGGLFHRLGDASYGIYLIHAPLLVVIFALVGGKGMVVAAAVGILALCLSIAFGAIEHRLYRRLSRLFRNPPRVAGTGFLDIKRGRSPAVSSSVE